MDTEDSRDQELVARLKRLDAGATGLRRDSTTTACSSGMRLAW